MALDSQTIPISFGRGLDTKTDPDQIQAGSFLSLSNVTFGKGMSFQKRNGYKELLPTTAKAVAAYNDELVLMDGESLYSYSPAQGTAVNKGSFTSVDIRTSVVARSADGLLEAKSAYSPAGYYLHVWFDLGLTSFYKYKIVASQTGATILGPTVIPGVLSQAFALGNYLLIVYVNSSYDAFCAIPISTLTMTAGAPIVLATGSFSGSYSGVVANNRLYISFVDINSLIHVLYLDSSLNVSYQATVPGHTGSEVFDLIPDSVNTQLWVTYSSGYNARASLFNADLSWVEDIQLFEGTELNPSYNATGFSQNGDLTAFVEVENYYPNTLIESNYILIVESNGQFSGVFLRGVGLHSSCFNWNGRNFFTIVYQGGLSDTNLPGFQPTYFLVDDRGIILAKLENTNAGGYGNLSPVNQIGESQFQLDCLRRDTIDSLDGLVVSNTGVDSVIIDFDSPSQYQSLTLGKVLNLSGGFLWQYDGNQVCENNFHLFPEDIFISTSGSPTTAIAGGQYQYQWIYQWYDNAGSLHQSNMAPAYTVTVPDSGTSAITHQVPTLRLTNKKDGISIVGYRTAPSQVVGTFFRVTPFAPAAIANSTLVDYITWNDTSPDTDITGNDILYTSGGILEDSGGIASAGITNFKNRLFLINAEDRNQLWYSKTTLEGTPVEMTDSETYYVDPRWGEVTAISVMDDKLIIFKESAIFYVAGGGPDATGNNNDFSDAIFVTSVVGCANPNSIVMTQNGLMFQSDKGIWILGRDTSVSYIGAPIEAYNGYTVTSAQVIPGTTQIRFTLSGGPTLVYDYYYQIWGTFSYQALGAVLFGNLFTFIGNTGVFQETPGVYSDNGTDIARSLTTGWLSFAGIQGFQRARKMFLMAEYLSPHIVQVGVAYDYENGPSQLASITPSLLYNGTWGSDTFWGARANWGGPGTRFQYEIDFERQKCQALQISLTESLDPNNPVFGPGSNWVNMNFVVGKKLGYPKLRAERKVS